MSVTKRFTDNNSTEYTSWQSFGPIAAPSVTPWFCFPVGIFYEGNFDADHFPVTAVPTIQFGRSNDSIAMSINPGYCGSSVIDNGYGNAHFYVPVTFTGTITKIRLAVAVSKYNSTYADVYASTSAGDLRVYETSEGTALNVAASCLGRKPVIVGGGKADKRITRMRYRLKQTAIGAEGWAMVPHGGLVIRFPDE